MTFMKSAVLATTVLALSPAFMSGPALAEKGGNGHGKGKHSQKSERSYDDRRYNDNTVVIIGDDRGTIRDYIRDDYRRHCPPGLAKKNNGCLPPGQAKKNYIIGYPLPRDVIYVPVGDDLLRHLHPVPRGYQYVRVDKDVLLIAEASKKVIDAVTLLSAVGD